MNNLIEHLSLCTYSTYYQLYERKLKYNECDTNFKWATKPWGCICSVGCTSYELYNICTLETYDKPLWVVKDVVKSKWLMFTRPRAFT